MTLNQNPEEEVITLQEEEQESQQNTGPADHETAEEQSMDSSIAADGLPLELVQELEYVKPASTDKKGKKQDDDEDATNLTLSSVSDARAVIEGYLFTSNEPLSVQRLSRLMNNLHPRTVRGLLLELQMEYDSRPGALQIVEIAGGFQMATRPHLADWMFRMHRHKRRSALSPATLETLAIVAYKQPITKGEVEAIRGVESSGTVRTLQDLNLVEASGRREVIGRPQLFVTTDQFLKAFGLKSLADLPSISELRNLFANEQKLQAAVAQQNSSEPSLEEQSGESQPEPTAELETPAETQTTAETVTDDLDEAPDTETADEQPED
ncbi:MAG: SMC-Scp complex subunit ScpB [Candidatus Sumerlaeaceae bacterium]